MGLREPKANSRQTAFTEPKKNQGEFSYWDVTDEGIPTFPLSATSP
jgi:hypothetical protein